MHDRGCYAVTDPKDEYPKWVRPHRSHIAPAFSEFHAHRDGTITVLVKNAEEEAMAHAPFEKK